LKALLETVVNDDSGGFLASPWNCRMRTIITGVLKNHDRSRNPLGRSPRVRASPTSHHSPPRII